MDKARQTWISSPPRSKAMLEVFRHALALTAAVQAQLALLLRLQWIAAKRVFEVLTAASFGAGPAPAERGKQWWFTAGLERYCRCCSDQ